MTQASPFVIEISAPPTPEAAARRLAHLPHLLLLESSMRQARLGRFSFLSADPVDWFQPGPEGESQTFDWLNQQLEFGLETLPELPPFQGGVAGLFGYEFNASIERIKTAAKSQAPAVSLGLYDVVVAWDHESNQCWIISTGAPAREPKNRQSRAIERAQTFEALLQAPPQTVRSESPAQSPSEGTPPGKWYPCPTQNNLTSNFDRNGYLATIRQALDHIHAGDIFQVNIAQQLCHPATSHSLELYQNLRSCNPATFAAFFDTGHAQVISASPERLVSVRDRIVETRPIKGTRRRTKHPEVDINAGQQLLTSEKDRAENVMIVDLMRNDLSRICKDDSVEVTQYVQLESYASVLHLVSAVQGELRSDVRPADLLRAVFPGGSISGAPKVRAMEIIAELEPHPRGPYCGSLGYLGFNGNADLNILIRTITAKDGYWTIPVGGGIVAGSIPECEYEETWTKAHAMLNAVEASSAHLIGSRS